MNDDGGTFRKIADGKRAEIYKVSETEAIKLFYPGYSLVEATEEYEKTAFVASVYDKALRMEPPGQTRGRISLSMELIRGRPLAVSLRSSDAAETGLSLGLMHRNLHIRPSEGLPRAVGIYEPAIREFPGISSTTRKRLIEFLHSRRDDRLCHGNFHPGNILQTRDEWRLIDWSGAFSGDPLADIARASSRMRKSRSAGRKNAFLEPLMRRRLEHRYIAGYFGREKVPQDDLKRWQVLNGILEYGRRKEKGASFPAFVGAVFLRASIRRMFRE